MATRTKAKKQAPSRRKRPAPVDPVPDVVQLPDAAPAPIAPELVPELVPDDPAPTAPADTADALALLSDIVARRTPPADAPEPLGPTIDHAAAPSDADAPEPATEPRRRGRRMKPGSVRWERMNRERAALGLPPLDPTGSTPAGPAAPAAPRAPRDNSRAQQAAGQGQQAPSIVPENVSPEERAKMEKAAKHASAMRRATSPGVTAPLAQRIAFGVREGASRLASVRGDHWKVTDAEAEMMGNAYAPVAAYLTTTVDPFWAMVGTALVTTALVVVPRLRADQAARRSAPRPAPSFAPDMAPAAPAPQPPPVADDADTARPSPVPKIPIDRLAGYTATNG